MRLQLTISVTVLAVLASASWALAQESRGPARATASVRVYADDDHVRVISPSAEVEWPVTQDLQLTIGTSVDAVSAASVDVVTQASPSEVQDLRVEGRATLVWSLSSRFRGLAGAVVSHENDYDSARPTLGVQVEVADRNATIDLSYTASIDSVSSAVDSDFSDSRLGHIAALGLTQILDPKTYLDVNLDLRQFSGYHANPYRLVPISNSESSVLFHVAERTPEQRWSAASRLGIRRAIGNEALWFVHASYRYYLDSWSLASHTLDGRILRSLGDGRYLAGLRLRGYRQGAADFYQAYYQAPSAEQVPTHRTRDRTLGGMDSVHAEMTTDAALGAKDGWRLRSTISLTHFWFRDFPAQAERSALTLGLSLLTPL